MSIPVTRGGLKLEAAITRFGIGVQGVRAVDVGASTGGFTDVLLRNGAAHVTAVDVGHGQLLPRLREDARVTSLENADWKTLALTVAPGPFDFFTVDVSFVAARNMLRGLAFRLRSGAEGVVLVKPQFELPDRLVREGKVDDTLRARALEAFRKKAEPLGFRLLAHADSPVAGGEGTVEILAHLKFEGRTERMPAPGESRGRAPGSRTAVELSSWFAIAAPGLEEVVRDEVAALPGVADVKQVDGGVEFTGRLEVGMRANLHLRVATRVLLRLGTVEARKFPELRRRIGKLPWKEVVPRDRPLRIEAAASHCRLYHTGALGENVELGVADAIGPVKKSDDEPTRVMIRGRDDQFTVSVDASGELLHRRGWRVETGKAPLRETLAAGLLRLAGYDPERPFLDPMCGAGTIVLEACAIALGVAPGLARRFAFERWAAFEPAVWDRLRDEALAAIRDRPPAPLFAWDRDPEAVATTRRNADRAGFLAHLSVEQATFGEQPPPASEGLVLVNPPYGRRLERTEDPARVLRARFSGWRAGLLVPGQRGPGHRLANGGLRVRLVVTQHRAPGYH